MADTKNKERTPLNEYTVKIINEIRYKVRSIYVGDKDFKKLFEDLIVKKTTQQQGQHCDGTGNTV